MENTKVSIALSKLKQFAGYTFQLHTGSEMDELAASISEVGLLVPIMVRRAGKGEYEIISGHRRVYAVKTLGWTCIEAIIVGYDDPTAVIAMVDSNINRERLLPSERAYSYKAKLEALKKQGQRLNDTSCQVGKKYRADSMVAEGTKDSSRNIHRYIRLTFLIPELLKRVDEGMVSFNPAVELSYLRAEEQRDFCMAMDYVGCPPSLSQAQRIRALSKSNQSTSEAIIDILCEEKKVTAERVIVKLDDVRSFFPVGYSANEIKKQIMILIDEWSRNNISSL